MDTQLPAKGSVYMGKIKRAADRMSAMIDGVLNYSAVNSLHGPMETIALDELLKNVEYDLELVMQQKSARITTTSIPPVQGVAILVYQLFYNLINNSLKFSKPGTEPIIAISAATITENGNT